MATRDGFGGVQPNLGEWFEHALRETQRQVMRDARKDERERRRQASAQWEALLKTLGIPDPPRLTLFPST